MTKTVLNALQELEDADGRNWDEIYAKVKELQFFTVIQEQISEMQKQIEGLATEIKELQELKSHTHSNGKVMVEYYKAEIQE